MSTGSKRRAALALESRYWRTVANYAITPSPDPDDVLVTDGALVAVVGSFHKARDVGAGRRELIWLDLTQEQASEMRDAILNSSAPSVLPDLRVTIEHRSTLPPCAFLMPKRRLAPTRNLSR